MNLGRRVSRKLTVAFVATSAASFSPAATTKFPSPPARPVSSTNGSWVTVSKDGKEKMKMRRLDDSIYIGSYDGNLFRAFHSDVAGTSFISAEDIDSAERK